MAAKFGGVIFDVDGVLVASPHERAWRETLEELMATDWRAIAPATDYRPERFTTAVYQQVVAGKPRLSGARAALEYFRVPDAARRAVEYAERKQRRMVELIEAGEFKAYPDALRFALALKIRGMRLAVASSSKNANSIMQRVRLDEVAREVDASGALVAPGTTLFDLFDVNVCGRDLPRGKPDPLIFLVAAEELGVPPSACVVVEDAVAGILAARAGGMAALGVARLGDQALLEAAGADLVVTTLDDVDVDALLAGRLERVRGGRPRPQPARRPR